MENLKKLVAEAVAKEETKPRSEKDLVSKVDKIIREILDEQRYKGNPIRGLSRKKLLKVVSILVIYSRLIENNIK